MNKKPSLTTRVTVLRLEAIINMEDVIWQRDDIRDLKSEHFADKIDEPPVLISQNKIPTTFQLNQESNDEKNNLESSSTSSSSCLLKAFGTCLQTLKFPIAFDENKTQDALDETRRGETRCPFDQPKRESIQNTQVDMRIDPNVEKSNTTLNELSKGEGVYLSDHPKRLLKLTDTEKRELLNGVIADFSSGNFPHPVVHVCRCRDAGVYDRSSLFSENESALSLTSSRQLSLMKCASNASVLLRENGSSLMVAINEYYKQNTCKFCYLYHNNFYQADSFENSKSCK